MSRCLYCYKKLEPGQVDFHPSCARHFFGMPKAPIIPYTRDNMSLLAEQVIRASSSVTGVQAKMSLDIDRGGRNEPARFTIVGLWGNYIFKPQSGQYKCLPELEDLTMKMASAAGIKTVDHSLIRLADGEQGYITKRIDRTPGREKVSMLDMCQLSNRLTEHKYFGTYPQLSDIVRRYSSAPLLDIQRFWEVVLFSWITGNSDMHCKNFSLIDIGRREYVLSPAYDLLSIKLADPYDQDELAMPLVVGGRRSGFNKASFMDAMTGCGLDAKICYRLMDKFAGHRDKWVELIESSFLPDDMKEDYIRLIDARLSAL